MQGSFRGLHPAVVKVILEQGYTSLNPLQEKAIPLILKGYNVLISAPTGSGKTEAALFPVFSKLIEGNLNQETTGLIHVLYITPLRSLNRDIYWRMARIAEKLNLRIMIRHGDTPNVLRRKMVLKPPQILITTPESLQFLLVGKRVRELLRGVRWVIVDEIHELIGDKRGIQLSVGLERLREITGRSFQRIGLSATISDIELAKRFLCQYQRVLEVQADIVRRMEIGVISPEEYSIESGGQIAELSGISSEAYARLKVIVDLLDKHENVLIFTNTRDTAEVLGSRLALFYEKPVKVHHGSLSREERIEAEQLFKKGQLKALVCTSSMELGIDVGQVNFVIQYMSPRQAIKLIQRVGRSSHYFTKIAKGIIVATYFDDILESLVLARRAVNGQLEGFEFHWKPYDVLGHQIVGIVLEYGRISLERLYEIITRAYPYKDLTFAEFRRVLNFVKNEGFIKVHENGEVTARRGAYKYYYENASTIPDTQKFKVRDIASMKFIGELDEDFVSLRCEEGYTFILAGKVWKVVNVDEENGYVNVVPATTQLGALPAWEGELIPVSYNVAREVGSLRRRLKLVLEGTYSQERLLKDYSLSEKLLHILLDFVKKHVSKGYPWPDDKSIVIEDGGKGVLMHACFGSKVNEGLGLLLSYILSKERGFRVLYSTDPYRVLLLSAFPLKSREVEEILLSKSLDEVRESLINAIKNSLVYKWRLVHVARRFGAIARERKVKLSKGLLKTFEETPIADEALKEVLVEKIDLEGVLRVVKGLREGRMRILRASSNFEKGIYSPLAEPILEARMRYGSPVEITPSEALLDAVKKRLENSLLTLICLHCLSTYTLRVKEMSDRPRCLRCRSVLLTVVYPHELQEKLKILRKRKSHRRLSPQEKSELERMARIASLMASYGKRAAMALAGRGIGPSTAVRILQRASDETTFLREIVKAEREYFRTRAFWD